MPPPRAVFAPGLEYFVPRQLLVTTCPFASCRAHTAQPAASPPQALLHAGRAVQSLPSLLAPVALPEILPRLLLPTRVPAHPSTHPPTHCMQRSTYGATATPHPHQFSSVVLHPPKPPPLFLAPTPACPCTIPAHAALLQRFCCTSAPFIAKHPLPEMTSCVTVWSCHSSSSTAGQSRGCMK